MKTLFFYHSRFCPRCRASRRRVEEFIAAHPDIVLEEVEVTRAPAAAIRDGIFMIPAARIGDRKVAGFVLTRDKLARLL